MTERITKTEIARRSTNTKREIEVKEHRTMRDEIVSTRAKLDEFTLRDFSEALLGEEFTEITYGKDGGQIKMGDLKMKMTGTSNPGLVGIELDKDQVFAIMEQAHPNLSRADIQMMLTHQPEMVKQITDAKLALNEHESAVNKAHAQAHKAANPLGMAMVELTEEEFQNGGKSDS